MKKSTKITAIILSVIMAFSAIPVMNAVADDGTKLLWSNSFETEDEQNAWTMYDLDGDKHDWKFKSSDEDAVFTAYDGKYSLYSESFTSKMETLEPDNIAISELIEIDDSTAPNIRLSWYAASQEAYNNKEHYSVYVFPGDATDDEIKASIETENDVFNETFKEETIAYYFRSVELNSKLDELFPIKNSDKTIRLAFRHHGSTDQRAVKIDAIKVEAFYKYDTLASYTFKNDLEGWTSIDGDGDGNSWKHRTEEENLNFRGQDGNSCLASASYSDVEEKSLYPENYLVSPSINISKNYYLPLLKWHVGAYDKHYFNEHYSVYAYSGNKELTISNIREELADTSVSELIFNENLPEPDDYNVFYARSKFLDDSYAGKTVRIIFVHHDCTDNYYIKLDNISLSAVINNEKTVTWDFGNGKLVTEKFKAGEKITAPENPTREGYDFGGWEGYTEGMIMPDDDITFKAVWALRVYNVNYYVDGAEYDSDKYEYGKAITLRDALVKEGYTFSGWKNADGKDAVLPGTMPAEDIAVYGTWTVNKHLATFNAGEGAFTDGSTKKTVDVDYGTTPEVPEAPAKEGYRFVGWADATGKIVTFPVIMPDENVTFTAFYETNTYMVKYYVNGNLVETLSGEYGDTIATKIASYSVPVGYEFDGWYTDAACKTKLAENAKISASTKLYAKTSVKTYDAVFMADGVEFKRVPTEFDTEINVPEEEPTKEGYVFTGWTPIAGIMDTEGATFEATWAEGDYTVTYKAEGLADEVFGLMFGEEFEIAADPYIDGCTFLGWSDTENGTVIPYEEMPATMPAENLVYYAVFENNEYTVTWVIDGAEKVETYEFGAAITAPEDPVKDGHRFDGWAWTNEAGEKVEEPATMPAYNVTATATWAVIDGSVYNVKIYKMGLDGETYELADTKTLYEKKDTEVTYAPETFEGFTLDSANSKLSGTVAEDGSLVLEVYYIRNQYNFTVNVDGKETTTVYYYEAAVTAPADPVKEGYKFAGWDKEIPATMPAENIKINAQWANQSYIITFNAGEGGSFKSGDKEITKEFNYGEKPEVPEEPTRTGYTFAGWVDADGNKVEFSEALPAVDLTVTAKWEVSSYKLVYKTYSDDEGEIVVYETFEVPFGTVKADMPVPENNPVRTGYSFFGWVPLPATMPAENVTITANWTVNRYTITFIDGDNEIVSITQDYNTEVKAPADPVKTGYTFAGWENEAGEIVTVPTTMPAKNIKLTAKWTNKSYKITFNAGDGGTFGFGDKEITKEFNYGTIPEAPETPIKLGYKFVGWTPELAPVTGEAEYTALFEENLANYTVETYIMDTEGLYESSADIKEEKQGRVGLVTTVKPDNKDGFTLDSANSTLSGTVTEDGLLVLKVYYARNQYDFKVEGNEEPTKYYYESTVASPVTPTKTGYTFTGWVDADGKKVDFPMMMPAENVTITAQWNVNKYDVTWVIGKETYRTDKEVAYGTEIKAPVPEKQGYVFSGWAEEIPATMPDNALTFTGKWEPAADTKYIVNIHTMNVEGSYDTKTKYLTGTTDSTVNADGYYTVAEGFELGADSVTEGVVAPDGSLVLDVKLNRKTFTISFNTNGGSAVSAISGLYGSAVKAPTNPTKTGYTFTGWVDADGNKVEIPATMPAENLTVTATYKCIATIEIKNKPSSNEKTINHGETLRLTAEVTNQPAGTDIGWYIDGNLRGTGETFDVNPPAGGTVEVTVKLIEDKLPNNPIVDADGNEISDSEKVSMKSGFFQKLISFFKNLFRLDRTVVQVIKFY